MKIIFYEDDTKKVKEVLEKVENPIPYGLDEIRWKDGGHSLFSSNYVIVNDDVNFEDITEEEFLRQFKEQAKFELAKVLEVNRVKYMVDGTLTEKEERFASDKALIDGKTSIEDVRLYLMDVTNRVD